MAASACRWQQQEQQRQQQQVRRRQQQQQPALRFNSWLRRAKLLLWRTRGCASLFVYCNRGRHRSVVGALILEHILRHEDAGSFVLRGPPICGGRADGGALAGRAHAVFCLRCRQMSREGTRAGCLIGRERGLDSLLATPRSTQASRLSALPLALADLLPALLRSRLLSDSTRQFFLVPSWLCSKS